ncbi:hypothetical protein LCGC14_1056160 [marine sediment metagenome]|uniref:Uncharacterized protein n=1 Tax=marine sediment metagenome TaxID=412755 RepID=A0A0F9QTF8_9ZZZZ
MWVINNKDSRGYYQAGYYKPDGTFYIHDAYPTVDEAELKVAFLNGGVYSEDAVTHLQEIAMHLENISIKGQVH